MLILSLEWGISPSEFWAMTLPEWFAIFFHKTADRTSDGRRRAGGLTAADVERLTKLMEDD